MSYESGFNYIFKGPDGLPAFGISRPQEPGMFFEPIAIAQACLQCARRGVDAATIAAWRDTITHPNDRDTIVVFCADYCVSEARKSVNAGEQAVIAGTDALAAATRELDAAVAERSKL